MHLMYKNRYNCSILIKYIHYVHIITQRSNSNDKYMFLMNG